MCCSISASRGHPSHIHSHLKRGKAENLRSVVGSGSKDFNKVKNPKLCAHVSVYRSKLNMQFSSFIFNVRADLVEKGDVMNFWKSKHRLNLNNMIYYVVTVVEL